jgi:lipoate-protein ligase A
MLPSSFMDKWRVIDTGPGEAGWNMAVDEALLVTAKDPGFAPTLRFYSWDRPSLSIGSFQKAQELNLARIESVGVPFVRRPTGGRAVLHDAELTYSIACPVPSRFFPSDLMGSYKTIGSCFIKGLRMLGLDVGLVPVSRNPESKKAPNLAGGSPLCFSSPSWHEVLADGKKLVGSAQKRLPDAFLQQGSLLMKMDIDGLLEMQSFKDEDARRTAAEKLSSKMTALHEQGVHVDGDTLKSALIEGFKAELGAELVHGGLTASETALARRLFVEKYSTRDWNLFRRTGEPVGR